MSYKRFWMFLSLIFILAVVLAGCQTAEPEAVIDEEPTEEAEPVSEVEEPAEEEITDETESTVDEEAVGGDIVYVLSSDVVSLDPHKTVETVSGMVNSQMFDYLTVLNPDGSVGPGLAESWETSEDNLTWTFNLREGITFHDGTPLNAEAVKANLERILNPDNGLPSVRLLSGVTEVNAVGENQLEIVTEVPFGPLPHHLSHYSLGIISPAALESMSPEELSQNPIGTGPFQFVSYTPNESIILQRNPDYWGEGPFVENVTFQPAPEAATRSVVLETGEADIVAKVPPQDVESLRSVEGVHIDVEPFTRVIFAHLNGAKEPFDDPNVRQALNWAIDRESIVNNILQGFASPATGPLGNGVFGYAETEGFGYDPDRARELLAEAGYEDGFSTTMWVPAGRYQGAEEAAQAVQAQLAEVGVDAQVEVMEWSSLLDEIRKGPEEANWEILVLGFAPATNDADWQLYSQFHTDSWAPLSNNRSFYSNPEVDELLEQGRFETDPAVREAVYAELLQIINEDAPELYMYQTTQIYGVNDAVSGLVYLPIDIQDLENVMISE